MFDKPRLRNLFSHLHDRTVVRSGAEIGLLSLALSVSRGVSLGDFPLAPMRPVEKGTLWAGFGRRGPKPTKSLILGLTECAEIEKVLNELYRSIVRLLLVQLVIVKCDKNRSQVELILTRCVLVGVDVLTDTSHVVSDSFWTRATSTTVVTSVDLISFQRISRELK